MVLALWMSGVSQLRIRVGVSFREVGLGCCPDGVVSGGCVVSAWWVVVSSCFAIKLWPQLSLCLQGGVSVWWLVVWLGGVCLFVCSYEIVS